MPENPYSEADIRELAWKVKALQDRADESQRGREIISQRLNANDIETSVRRDAFNQALFEIRMAHQKLSSDVSNVGGEIDSLEKRMNEKWDTVSKRLDGIRNIVIAIITPLVGGILAAAIRVAMSSSGLK